MRENKALYSTHIREREHLSLYQVQMHFLGMLENLVTGSFILTGINGALPKRAYWIKLCPWVVLYMVVRTLFGGCSWVLVLSCPLKVSSRLCSHTLLHICSFIWVFLPTTDTSLSIYFSTMKPNIYSHELAQGECSECEVCALLERIRCFPWEMEVYFDLLHWAGKSDSEYCLYKSFTLAQQSSAL